MSSQVSGTDLSGTIQWDPKPTKTFIKNQIDKSVETGANISKGASKDAIKSFIPVGLSAIGKILKYFGVPKIIYKPLTHLAPEKIADSCDSMIDPCHKKTAEVSKKSLHKSTDVCVDSSYSLRNRIFSFFGKN